MTHLSETDFWDDLMHGIYGPRKGGARIIVDAENASTGVGKTGLAVSMARLLSKVFDYELQEDDLTLSGAHYLQRWRDHPDAEQPSVLILDELGGAGAGNARRAMSQQNVDLGNAWQLMRKKRIVTIVTLPHWSDADKRMRRQADFRLWCREQPIGYFRPYKVGSDFDEGVVNTEGYDDINRIKFPNMDYHDDPYFKYLSEQKDELLNSEYFDADKLEDGEDETDITPDEARRQERIEIAQRKRENGDTVRDIADEVNMSHTWVVENTTAPSES